jgi:hypothetical protein
MATKALAMAVGMFMQLDADNRGMMMRLTEGVCVKLRKVDVDGKPVARHSFSQFNGIKRNLSHQYTWFGAAKNVTTSKTWMKVTRVPRWMVNSISDLMSPLVLFFPECQAPVYKDMQQTRLTGRCRS